jgi:glucokinase
MAVIGLDLGATKLAGALFDRDGNILARDGALLGQREGDEVGQLVSGCGRALRRVAGERGIDVEAVGVSVPGIAGRRDGTVWAPNIVGWEQYPLRAVLRAELGESCPIVVESDRAASILGEVSRGIARGRRHAIFLAVGTGIGAGILVDGSILRGAHDIAGAIGWMGLDRPYRTEYDRRGGFESHASGAGIARVAREILEANARHEGPLGMLAPGEITAQEVFAAYEAGDNLAARAVANAVECWGMAIGNMVSLFDPEIIVLGGGLFGPAAKLLDQIIAEARRWAQPVSFAKVNVCVSSLGPEACLYGTGELALRASREGVPG